MLHSEGVSFQRNEQNEIMIKYTMTGQYRLRIMKKKTGCCLYPRLTKLNVLYQSDLLCRAF